MRENGVRKLAGASADRWPDCVRVRALGQRMMRRRCEIVGADASPNWWQRPERQSAMAISASVLVSHVFLQVCPFGPPRRELSPDSGGSIRSLHGRLAHTVAGGWTVRSPGQEPGPQLWAAQNSGSAVECLRGAGLERFRARERHLLGNGYKLPGLLAQCLELLTRMFDRKFYEGRRRLHARQLLEKAEGDLSIRLRELDELVVVFVRTFHGNRIACFDDLDCFGSGGAHFLVSFLRLGGALFRHLAECLRGVNFGGTGGFRRDGFGVHIHEAINLSERDALSAGPRLLGAGEASSVAYTTTECCNAISSVERIQNLTSGPRPSPTVANLSRLPGTEGGPGRRAVPPRLLLGPRHGATESYLNTSGSRQG